MNKTNTFCILFCVAVAMSLSPGCGDPEDEIFQAGARLKGNCTVTLSGLPAAGSVAVGTYVALTATGSCNSGTPEYHISVRDPAGSWQNIKTWGSANTATWNTTGRSPGGYRLLAKIRAVGSGDTWEGYDYSQRYTLTGSSGGPCTAATLSVSPASPQAQGTSVTFTGGSTCPSGTTPEYRFVARGPDMVLRQVQGWSSSPTYTWNTTSALTGQYRYYMHVRDKGTVTPYDAYGGPLSYEITQGTSACINATLSASPASPQTLGGAVTLTASSTCGAGVTAHYRFVARKPDTTYVQLRTWAAASTFSWETRGLDQGTWQLQVYSRASNSSSSAEGISSKLPFTLNPAQVSSSLVSVSSSSAAGNGASSTAAGKTAVSSDGRYVAFESVASNLVAGDTNGVADVFLRDRTLGTTARISVGSSGQQLSLGGTAPAISGDGRYIAFATTAGIVAADGNGVSDIYLYDRTTGAVALASMATGGAAASGTSANLSSNGQFVVWATTGGQVYRLNRNTSAVDRVDLDSSGNAANGVSSEPDVSGDGRYVSFTSAASNLAPYGDGNGVTDVFVKDVTGGGVTRASVANNTVHGNTQLSSPSFGGTISDDGERVTFMTTANDVVLGLSSGGKVQAYVRLWKIYENLPVSVSNSEDLGDDDTSSAAISGDGTKVAFSSEASNLHPGDTSALEDVFVRLLAGGVTHRLSMVSAGGAPNAWSRSPSISGDGEYAVYTSAASDLVSGDSNGASDVFFAGVPAWPSPRQVIFGAAIQGNPYTLYTINTDGTGLAQATGWGELRIEAPTFVGSPQLNPTANLDPVLDKARKRLVLPGGDMSVSWYHEKIGASNRVGILLREEDGDVSQLYSVSGKRDTYFDRSLAVSPSGNYLAGIRYFHRQLILIRTDGNTFPGGASFVAWTLASEFYRVATQHVTDKAVYLWTRATSAAPHTYNLWWAPVSGSQAPAKITLPVAGGTTPAYYTGLASSADGGKVAVLAGASRTSQDLAIVDGTTGAAVKITSSPAAYLGYTPSSSTYLARDCQLALSTGGTWVAYVRDNVASGTGTGQSLFVARTDGTGTPYEVSNSSNFSATSPVYTGLRWVSDDALVFLGYAATTHKDIYRYLASTQALLNVTQRTDTTKPYSMSTAQNGHYIKGKWLSPNGAYLYYIGSATITYSLEVHAIDLSSWQVSRVKPGVSVDYDEDDFSDGPFVTCTSGTEMFFKGDGYLKSWDGANVYTFDANAPSKVTQLTDLPAFTGDKHYYIKGFRVSPDCKMVTLGRGDFYNGPFDAYAVRVGPPASASKAALVGWITSAPDLGRFFPTSGDNSQMVFIREGTTSGEVDLMVSGTHASLNAPRKLWSGPSTTALEDWILFGVK